MNMEFFWTNSQSLMTVLSFITFVGILLWSYSGRRKQAFEEAAHLPFADEFTESLARNEVDHG